MQAFSLGQKRAFRGEEGGAGEEEGGEGEGAGEDGNEEAGEGDEEEEERGNEEAGEGDEEEEEGNEEAGEEAGEGDQEEEEGNGEAGEEAGEGDQEEEEGNGEAGEKAGEGDQEEEEGNGEAGEEAGEGDDEEEEGNEEAGEEAGEGDEEGNEEAGDEAGEGEEEEEWSGVARAAGMRKSSSRGIKPTEPGQWLLIGIAVAYMTILVDIPFINVIVQAFSMGTQSCINNLLDPAFQHAMKMTFLVAGIVVPLNTVFGLIMAIWITRHQFPFKTFLPSCLDLPFSISPVVVGLMLMLLYGRQVIWDLRPLRVSLLLCCKRGTSKLCLLFQRAMRELAATSVMSGVQYSRGVFSSSSSFPYGSSNALSQVQAGGWRQKQMALR